MRPCLRASSRALRILLVGLAACALPAARADCVDGVRQPRAAEADFHERAMAALVAALPPVPRNAESTGRRYDFGQLPGLGVLCTDTKVGAFSPSVRRDYLLRLDQADGQPRRAERAWVVLQINAPTLPRSNVSGSRGFHGQDSPQRSAALRVMNVVWSINGEAGALRDALEASLDKARLKALLAKPLPTVAESQAAAQSADAAAAAVVIAPTSSAAPVAPGAAAPAPAQASRTPAPAGGPDPTAALPAPPGPPGDPLKGAVDAAQKLRGLFNR